MLQSISADEMLFYGIAELANLVTLAANATSTLSRHYGSAAGMR
jgi:hypothetical protein